MKTNDILKFTPPEDNRWNGEVSLGLGYPHAGWIQFAISCTSFGQSVIIDLSVVTDPFPDFFKWLDAIAAGHLPAEFYIDEEGYGKTLQASPVNKDVFLFEIGGGMWKAMKKEEQPVLMYVRVSTNQFLGEFLTCWDDFLQNRYDPKEWADIASPLPILDTSRIRAFVER